MTRQHTLSALAYLQFIGLLAIYTVLGVARNPGQVVGDYNDLLMHFSGYVAAAMSCSLALPRWRSAARFALLFCYSTGVELVQYFLPWRSFDLWDIAANSLGIFLGLCVWYLLYIIYQRWTQSS